MMMETKKPEMASEQEALLARLVEAVRAAAPNPWEKFVAVRVGLAGIVIYHPSAEPITAGTMEDLETLAACHFLDLTRTPSGARLFDITRCGFEHYEQRHSSEHAK